MSITKVKLYPIGMRMFICAVDYTLTGIKLRVALSNH